MARRPDKRKARPGGTRAPVTTKRRNASAPVGGRQLPSEAAGELDPEIRARYVWQAGEIRRYGSRICGDIISVGTILRIVKSEMPHGQWLPWIKYEFNWGERTAQNYMAAAAAFAKSDADLEGLQIDVSALYLLSKVSVPDTAREKAIEQARAGTRISLAAAKQIVITTIPEDSMPVLRLTMGAPKAEEPKSVINLTAEAPRAAADVVSSASLPRRITIAETVHTIRPRQTFTIEEEVHNIPTPIYHRPVVAIESLADLLDQLGEIIDAAPDLDVLVLGEKERIDAIQKVSRAVGALQALRERIDAAAS